jgi:hypothetical protein
MNSPYQDRVRQEALELATKIEALKAFLIRHPTLAKKFERKLLVRQLTAMTKYHSILLQRIAQFS